MLPAREQAADAIRRLGCGEPLDDVAYDVWAKLTELGLVHRGRGGTPELTVRGEQVRTAIESGENDYVPELDDGQWVDGKVWMIHELE